MTDTPTVTFYNKILLAATNDSCQSPKFFVSDGGNSLGDRSPYSFLTLSWQYKEHHHIRSNNV